MLPRNRFFWIALVGITALLFAAAGVVSRTTTAAYAQTVQTPTPTSSPAGMMNRTISVTGAGVVNAQPDIAIIVVGVQTDQATASQALAQNNKQMQAVMDTLNKASIASADIRTASVQLYPRYDNQPNAQQGQQANKIIGYTASNTVEVTVRNLNNLGSLLDQIVTAGGNQIQGIRFDLSDQSKVMDQARQAAMQDAAHKAQQLATLANAKLGAVMTINEISNAPIPYQAAMASSAQGGSVPVSPGTQPVTVNVDVTWELQTP